jgi:SAM-dependent methyltransferase
MAVAPDGSPVEVYLRLPTRGEPELIASALRPGASVLEIGCGTGRLTHPLVELGFRVTAVDNEPQMLAHVRGAETVLADAASIELGRRFDCVLLASHFVNDADDRGRRALLAACARHLAADDGGTGKAGTASRRHRERRLDDGGTGKAGTASRRRREGRLGGVLLAEAYPPDLEWVPGRESKLGDVVVRLAEADRDGDLVSATMEYELDGRRWRQPFTACILDEPALRSELALAGLRFDRWLARERGWLAATHAPGERQ